MSIKLLVTGNEVSTKDAGLLGITKSIKTDEGFTVSVFTNEVNTKDLIQDSIFGVIIDTEPKKINGDSDTLFMYQDGKELVSQSVKFNFLVGNYLSQINSLKEDKEITLEKIKPWVTWMIPLMYGTFCSSDVFNSTSHCKELAFYNIGVVILNEMKASKYI